MITPFVKGFLTTASLIGGIGIQNVFILKQGLIKSHVLPVILACWMIDVLLITIGVNGVGKLILAIPNFLYVTRYGGAAFLFCYGARAFYSSYKNDEGIAINSLDKKRPLIPTMMILLGVSFLNPHTYLDTMVLIGSVGAHLSGPARVLFIGGATSASLFWFIILCYGARYLAPYFQKNNTWRIFNFFVGCMMWTIAISLLYMN
ncbi:MAG: LysE/ArgO family amino acid transporter [Janthinobacterium lividum]